jgi:hypothetical protein
MHRIVERAKGCVESHGDRLGGLAGCAERVVTVELGLFGKSIAAGGLSLLRFVRHRVFRCNV